MGLTILTTTTTKANRYSPSRSRKYPLPAAARLLRARIRKILFSHCQHRSWYWKGKILMILWTPTLLPNANQKVISNIICKYINEIASRKLLRIVKRISFFPGFVPSAIDQKKVNLSPSLMRNQRNYSLLTWTYSMIDFPIFIGGGYSSRNILQKAKGFATEGHTTFDSLLSNANATVGTSLTATWYIHILHLLHWPSISRHIQISADCHSAF